MDQNSYNSNAPFYFGSFMALLASLYIYYLYGVILKFKMMTKTDNFVYKGLLIIAWLIFVGLSIEAGGLIVNFFFSLFKPELLQNLYQKIDLTQLYNESELSFFCAYGFILTIAILKPCMFYIVIRLMHKLDLSKPFSSFAARQISLISYFTLSIGFLSLIAKKITDNLNQFWEDGQAFILMGAVIYIIAVIFKKGVDIQNENDLTV